MEEIGRNVYANLINQPNLTDEQKKQIEAYKHKIVNLTPEQAAKVKQYKEHIFNLDESKEIVFDKNQMWRLFREHYKSLFGVEFIINDITIRNLAPIFYYFLKDDRFFDCEHLTEMSEPSFDKGLILIGGYGNSKTSTMQAMKQVLVGTKQSYAFRNSNNVVSDFEACGDTNDKLTFWSTISKGTCLYDDLKAEREASNYGKVNLFKDILEKRSLIPEITHATCNYRDGSNDIEDAVMEIGERYGSRVYDRLFQMFNIVHFKGNSMRK